MKDNERQRCTLEAPIQVSDISRDTKLPKDMDTFWPSPNNKLKLEDFLRSCMMEHFTQNDSDTHVVLSGTVPNGSSDGISPNTQSVKNRKLSQLADLDSDLEEADVRIIPHAIQAVRNGVMLVVILSSDTDVFVLAMHFSHLFVSKGLKELWLRGELATKQGIYPFMSLLIKLGSQCVMFFLRFTPLLGVI